MYIIYIIILGVTYAEKVYSGLGNWRGYWRVPTASSGGMGGVLEGPGGIGIWS